MLIQVALPALHIDLGIFYKLFQLLETECHHLDMILAKDTSQPVLQSRWDNI